MVDGMLVKGNEIVQIKFAESTSKLIRVDLDLVRLLSQIESLHFLSPIYSLEEYVVQLGRQTGKQERNFFLLLFTFLYFHF